MNEWFYARGGQQSGPVSFEKLVELVKNGTLHPAKDLAWTSTMKDWIPVGQVPGIITPAPVSNAVSTDPSNPYAPPSSSWKQAAPLATGAPLPEIEPGSEPIRVGACVERGFELTKRHFGTIMLVGLIYFGITMAMSVVQNLAPILASGVPIFSTSAYNSSGMPSTEVRLITYWIAFAIAQLLSIFLSLGLCRIGLNLVSGKEISVGMLFGGGKLFVRAVGATLLYFFIVSIGLVLLIVPGIYWALKYGQYMYAMVDRDLGIKESFAYSSSITLHSRFELFLLYIVCALIALAGLIACFVGVFFAAPVAWLSMVVAYRWMQYGHRSTFDDPGTRTPLLTHT